VILARHLDAGGWTCNIPGCRYEREGRNDIETHLTREHGVHTLFMMPYTHDIVDRSPDQFYREKGVL